jgi:hypothetical protein
MAMYDRMSSADTSTCFHYIGMLHIGLFILWERWTLSVWYHHVKHGWNARSLARGRRAGMLALQAGSLAHNDSLTMWVRLTHRHAIILWVRQTHQNVIIINRSSCECYRRIGILSSSATYHPVSAKDTSACTLFIFNTRAGMLAGT